MSYYFYHYIHAIQNTTLDYSLLFLRRYVLEFVLSRFDRFVAGYG